MSKWTDFRDDIVESLQVIVYNVGKKRDCGV